MAAGTTLRTDTLEEGGARRLRSGAVLAEVELVPVKGKEQLQTVVQIAELDPVNVYPEVLLSAFTGGAHCCNQTQVLTRPLGQTTWQAVDLGPFDGGPMPARIRMGEDVPLVVSVDNRFLYKFAYYVCGGAPPRLWQLQADRFVDVSHQRCYWPIFRQALQRIQAQLQAPIQPNDNPNGWLAAYVANKATVGSCSRVGCRC